MKVISCDRPVFAPKHCYKPFVRYITSDYEANYLLNNTPITNWTCSSFNPYEHRYGGQDLNGKKVAIYRHTAYGDQLMISAVPRYLKALYPNATVHLYCDHSVLDMWQNNPYVGGAAIPIPIPFDVARAYDYHIFYEGMLENNGEPDQDNCYDDFFGMIGLRDVPAQFKRPHIIVRPEDYCCVQNLKLDLSGKYMVYHVSPANKNRRYNPAKAVKFIKMFLNSFTFEGWRVLLVGKSDGDREDLSELAGRPDVTNLVDKTASFRDTIPIIERASLVVAPDSSVMHLAACFPDVPTISLWGLFHPNDRVKYYPNHHPLFHPECCEFAPCHNHEFTLPLRMCTKAKNWVDGSVYCAALENISPEEILETAEKIYT